MRGRSWLERLPVTQEAAGSSPVAPATSRSEPLGEAGIGRTNFNSMVFVDVFIPSANFLQLLSHSNGELRAS